MTKHQRRGRVYGVLAGMVMAGSVAVIAACVPPPTPTPPPPTTAAMKYQECAQPELNLLPNRCYTYMRADPATMTLWTDFGALTTSPTYILAEVHLEKWQPVGSTWIDSGFPGSWVDRVSGMSTTGVSKTTFPVGCEHGTYRWKLSATFANAPGYTFYKVSEQASI